MSTPSPSSASSEPAYKGIVRAAKRPPGWHPPGPVPAGPGDDPALWPDEGEDLCFLTGQWRIFQRVKGHRYSLDDVATAWYALTQTDGRTITRAADIGCGIGSVLMMVAWGLPHVRSVGVEAQELSFGLAQRSLRYNGAADRVIVRNGDLRDPDMWPEGQVFDLVTGTPPYIPLGHGSISDKEQCGPCRFEFRGGIEDYCLAAARLMRPDGRFVVCHSGAQAPRVEAAALGAKLTILARKDVIPREGRDPLLAVYLMAHHDDTAPTEDGTPHRIDPPLIVRDASGARTADYRAMRDRMGMPP